MNNIILDVTTKKSVVRKEDSTYYIIGLCLALSSSLFIGGSFIIKKLSLVKLGHKGGLRAGAGGYGYLKDWLWWLGLLTMAFGEFANFTAYTFAPASLVTPLGGLSVLVSAVLSSKLLKEELNSLGKLGCVLCILGSIIIIIHSPKEQEIQSMDELITRLHNPLFINYVIIVLMIALSIIFYLGPRYGQQHVVIYITLCSAIGSLTVMASKGLGLVLKELFSSKPTHELTLSYCLICVFFISVVACVLIQMNYLNKALDLFNTNVVTPTYYVIFTSLVIVASAILFEEWQGMKSQDIVGNICGFLVIIIAIYLLQGFKDSDCKVRQKINRNIYRSDYGTNIY